MSDHTPILPAHIDETVRAIARLHADHRREAGALHKVVERTTTAIAQPRFIGAMTCLVLLWIGANLLAMWRGAAPWDPPPFYWLQGSVTIVAFYVTVLILTTQRRDDQLAGYREQLTLELAILGEQKSAKIIALLEEMRRDLPMLRNRVDKEALAMSEATDPEIVLEAIKESALDVGASGAGAAGPGGVEGQSPSPSLQT